MKKKVVIGICALGACLFTASAFGRQEAPQPLYIPVMPVPEYVEIMEGVIEMDLSYDPGTPRYLVFYPPGKAPSAELEFEPVPFESLLPTPESNFDYYQIDGE